METEEHQLNAEIMALTLQLSIRYPEIYRNLNEMPITISSMSDPEVKIKQLRDYEQSLKTFINKRTGLHNPES